MHDKRDEQAKQKEQEAFEEKQRLEEFQKNWQDGIYNAAVNGDISQMEVNVKVSASGAECMRKVRIVFLPDMSEIPQFLVHQKLEVPEGYNPREFIRGE